MENQVIYAIYCAYHLNLIFRAETQRGRGRGGIEEDYLEFD